MSNKVSQIIRKISPYLSSLVILGLVEWFLLDTSNWLLSSILLVFVVFVAISHLINWKIFSFEFLFWFVMQTSFLLSSLLFVSFLETDWIQHIIVILVALICFLFLKNIYLFINNSQKYQTNALEYITSYINFITLFFLFSSCFNLIVFMSWPVWKPLIFIVVVVYVLSLTRFWSHKIELKKAWLYSLILTVIFSQLFWVFSYLPISNIVSGLIFVLFYFSAVNISLDFMSVQLNKNNLTKNILISVIAIVLVLLTAQWI